MRGIRCSIPTTGNFFLMRFKTKTPNVCLNFIAITLIVAKVPLSQL